MSYPSSPFKKHEITIQPQARLCMQKLHITEEEVLTTINEWESGEFEGMTPEEADELVAFPESADDIPAFYSLERPFPQQQRVICVTYSTSIKKQRGKRKIHAHIHWVNTRPPLDLLYGRDLTRAPETVQGRDWLIPVRTAPTV